MLNTLAILGAGRVGRALGLELRRAGWNIGAVVTRSKASARRAARFIGAGTALPRTSGHVLNSSVILIATPDAEISEVTKELVRLDGHKLRGKVVLHTSGALGSQALIPLRKYGAAIGSMHPLQSFTGASPPPLAGRVFAIEGEARAVRTARKIARALRALPLRIDAKNKPLYHAAAALSAGHVLAIVEAATRVLMSIGMRRSEAVRALLPMTRQVLENYERLGPRAAWTGPLARGDHAVVNAHVRALARFSPQYRAAYEVLNRVALRVLT